MRPIWPLHAELGAQGLPEILAVKSVLCALLQRKLEALRAAVRGQEKRASELQQEAHTTSDAADVAQV